MGVPSPVRYLVTVLILHVELLNPPNEVGRSHGIGILRGIFSIYVLLFAHVAFWADAVQGKGSVPSWLTSISNFMVWLFQSRFELNPAVLGFIVLSGFCIHRNGLRSRIGLGSFAIRRAFRILPVFWLASIFGIVMFTAYFGPAVVVGGHLRCQRRSRLVPVR